MSEEKFEDFGSPMTDEDADKKRDTPLWVCRCGNAKFLLTDKEPICSWCKQPSGWKPVVSQ